MDPPERFLLIALLLAALVLAPVAEGQRRGTERADDAATGGSDGDIAGTQGANDTAAGGNATNATGNVTENASSSAAAGEPQAALGAQRGNPWPFLIFLFAVAGAIGWVVGRSTMGRTRKR